MNSNFKILLVEDMASFRSAVSQLLGVYNDVEEAENLAVAREKLSRKAFDVVILDKCLPDGEGIDLVAEIKLGNPNCAVIVLTSDSDFSSVKHCIARGADDYVVKSETAITDLLVRIPMAVSRIADARQIDSIAQTVKSAFRYEIIGKSLSIMELRESVMSLKGSGAHVLITGESGTGKELIARRLNAIEDSRKRPFVAINCGAIPENLAESEIFGHKKGSFTGAIQDRAGKFELAHGGDLFLDEVGELPLPIQIKLLRVIQEGEFSRVGDDRLIKVKCRIIAATNRNLESLIAEGKFRADLYHRLNVVHLTTTPLRERQEDVPDLAKSFILQIAGPNFKLSDRATNSLASYDWPGNIRELRNHVERAIIASKRRGAKVVDFQDVHSEERDDLKHRLRKIESNLPISKKNLSRKEYESFLETAEKEYLRTALELVHRDVSELASLLEVGRSTLFKKLASLGINSKGGSRHSSIRHNLSEGKILDRRIQ